MQISRHWRMNAQRYRLEGARTLNGDVRLQVRPTLPQPVAATQPDSERVAVKVRATAAR
jgi:hypothetical protein